jgi:sulfur-carrier protein adenylyltransferase/sulfurtransferase
MNDPKNQPSSEILTQKEIRRYNSQINNSFIGLVGQEKIKESKILVIGAGGKGTSILQNLSAIGVGKLGISDNSFIEESDLNRQHLFGNNDIGKHKAIVVKQKLQEINHLISFEVHNVFIEEKNAEPIFRNYNILIDSTNTLQSHLLISDIALKLNIPLIYTSVSESSGQITIFNFKNKNSFRDVTPNQSNLKKSELFKVFYCQASILSIIGAIAANETIKVILNIDTPLNSNLLTFNINEYSFHYDPIS